VVCVQKRVVVEYKKWVTQGRHPIAGTGRPERGHKGGEGERGMKDTGKDTPNPVADGVPRFHVVVCLMVKYSGLEICGEGR